MWRGVVVAVYVVGLAIGTVTHLTDLFVHGVRSHAVFAPYWLDVYWTSLTLFDPLALALVVLGAVRGRSTAGVWLVCAVMVTDLAANAYAVYVLLHSGVQDSPGLQRLLAFGLFVAVTAPWLAKESQRHISGGTVREPARSLRP
ncbi:hypothetical protein GCM10010329_39740 [Streptomyces spiroverticillatus]|uniref:Uncharacterized protein n=1 Tax=Streptomyces finlayi TaxID=67296 RepID=A0A918WZL3_9ACTN|nr:hypothetical protein GCM10010329_39740 [Streptomyces spiroverticillatus]GHC98219.1 hypothetical protein GCM10010334_40500 [Streptomyces finlayi]